MGRFHLTVLLVFLVGCTPTGRLPAKNATGPDSARTSAPDENATWPQSARTAVPGASAPRSGRVLETKPLGKPRVFVWNGAFSPDGKFLLIAYNFQDAGPKEPEHFTPLRLWDMTTGRLVRTFSESEYCLTFLPDSQRVLSERDGQPLRVWDVRSGEVVRTLDESSKDATCATVSADGKLAMTGGAARGGVVLWDLATGKPIRTLDTKAGRAVMFSPDGRWAFATYGETPFGRKESIAWNVKTGEQLYVSKDSEGWKYPLVISPDGQVAVSDEPSQQPEKKVTLVLWEVATGIVLRKFSPRAGDARTELHAWGLAGAFTPDGKYVVTVDEDGWLRRWSVGSGRMLSAVRVSVTVAAITPDASLAFVSSGADWGSSGLRLEVWDTAAGKLVHTLKQPRT